MGEKLKTPQQAALALKDDLVISDTNFFMQEIENKLKEMKRILKKPLCTIHYSQTELTAHELIYDQIAGCTSQCPFCKSQCERTINNHQGSVKHSTHHCPVGLGGYHWTKDDTMDLDVCTFLVASNKMTFQNNDTKGKAVPYKKYRDYYPEWSIPADMSLEESLVVYWSLLHCN